MLGKASPLNRITIAFLYVTCISVISQSAKNYSFLVSFAGIQSLSIYAIWLFNVTFISDLSSLNCNRSGQILIDSKMIRTGQQKKWIKPMIEWKWFINQKLFPPLINVSPLSVNYFHQKSHCSMSSMRPSRLAISTPRSSQSRACPMIFSVTLISDIHVSSLNCNRSGQSLIDSTNKWFAQDSR